MDESKLLEVAKQAAKKAGQVILGYYGKKHKYFVKGEKSNFATQADLDAEKIILKTLKDNFPKHNIISEEAGETQNGSEYTWVIDPLDGTIVFSVGLPTFSVSIGLLKDEKPILGVVYQALMDNLYYSFEGQGAYLNGKKTAVSKTADLSDSVLGVDFAHMAKRMKKTQTYIMPFLNKIRYPVSLGGDALIFALVGNGVLDGFATDTNIWDCIAGAVIITEAGGRVTDGKGEEIDWSKKRLEIVTSNGLIHDQILKVLNP
ncbi:inositol monophosphatase [Candidatus Daviesbacteria bacterium]|nr:inositol monophosphatase [Candidatus Daviesbacteria bacterium]